MPRSDSAPLAATPARRWRPSLTGGLAAGFILAGFWILLVASVRQKSLTSDEIAHAAAGYAYWRFDDYRLNPENGNLPQRVMGLGLALAPGRFPSLETEAWRDANEWQVGDQWFHHSGNDVAGLLLHGRAAMALLAVILGAVVWAWSRRLFGPRGGLVSLLLLVLSPTILANGPLMTSDTCAALFFLAAVGTLWRLLQKITPGRILASGLCLGGLFVSKMSAPLIAPIALALLVVRLIDGRPLPVGGQLVVGRSRQAVVLAVAGLAPLAIAWAVIWASYGFRYTAFAPAAGPGHFADRWESVLGQPDPLSLVGRLDLTAGQQAAAMRIMHARSVPLESWQPARLAALEEIGREVLTPAQGRRLAELEAAPAAAPLARLVEFLRQRHGLPEAYLYGQLSAWKYSRLRASFLNGETSLYGWRWFFPYTFLVKTPLACFGIGGLALAAALRRRPVWPGLYAAAPLWTLLLCYGAAVLGSHLNIGHRHILALYPPLFVLCGAAAGLGDSARTRRAWTLALGCLLAALAADVLGRFPNYLAYFNALAGGPREGYRHLVDSSLDWGQDLPGVQAYLAREGGAGPVYFSYFGTGSPRSYSIPAQRLYSFAGNDVPAPVRILNPPAGQEGAAAAEALRLDPGYEVVARAAPRDGHVPILLVKSAAALRLDPGTYLISATMLQPLAYDFGGPLGPWNARYEAVYQNLSATVRPLLSGDARTRRSRLTEKSPEDWAAILPRFEMFRFARLTAYLRRREPDDTIGYSILVYHLGAADLARALDGPPPELGLDLLRQLPLAPGP